MEKKDRQVIKEFNEKKLHTFRELERYAKYLSRQRGNDIHRSFWYNVKE